MDYDANCPFCQKFNSGLSDTIHPIFDQIIWENNNFVVVPSKGALVEGYLLIIPRKHYYSIANLPADFLSDLLKIKSFSRRILTEHFTSPIFFEHGPVCSTNRAGSCLDHAHLHCVPLDLDIVPRLRLSHQLVRLEKFEDITRQVKTNQSYIYFENQNQGMFIFSDASVPSQYLRRIIAEELGIPYEWDWAVSTFEQKVVSTLEVLKSVEFPAIHGLSK